MTHFIKSGNRISLAPEGSIEVSEVLAPLTYLVKKNEQTGEFYLEEIPNMIPPKKMYGELPFNRSERIIKTFNNRSRSTGVLLCGEKGSGKTMLTKVLSEQLILNHKTPTILVDQPFTESNFTKLINDLTTPSMIVFDEFEKVWDEEDQPTLLSLLDGTSTCKHLFVLTTNSGDINSFMLNRPGRIFYKFDYESLDAAVIQEYAEETVINKKHTQSVIDISSLFMKFNFDMLQALVEEMNRYDESADSAVQYLNVSPANEEKEYKVEVLFNGQPWTEGHHPYLIEYDPISRGIELNLGKSETHAFERRHDIKFNHENVTRIGEGGKIFMTKEIKEGTLDLVLCKQPKFKYQKFAF